MNNDSHILGTHYLTHQGESMLNPNEITGHSDHCEKTRCTFKIEIYRKRITAEKVTDVCLRMSTTSTECGLKTSRDCVCSLSSVTPGDRHQAYCHFCCFFIGGYEVIGNSEIYPPPSLTFPPLFLFLGASTAYWIVVQNANPIPRAGMYYPKGIGTDLYLGDPLNNQNHLVCIRFPSFIKTSIFLFANGDSGEWY